MKKALILTSVVSMLKQFNINNIKILKSLGYEVHVASNFKNPGTISNEASDDFLKWCKENSIICHHIGIQRNPFNLTNIIIIKQIKAILSEYKFDVLHLHSPVGGILGRLASLKYRKKGLKVIYTAHGFHFYKNSKFINWLIYKNIEKICSYVTDVLITINEEDYINAKKYLNAKNVKLVPGVGVDLKKFPIISEERKLTLRKDYNLSKDDFIMIFVGELNNNKNQIMLLNSVETLVKKIDNLKLLLIGKGENFEYYNQIIREKELNKYVDLLGYREDVIKLNQMSDVVVSSSKREGLPVNIMEGMSVGLPIIATNCRGNRDLVHHGVNGFLCDINNVEEMTEYIYKLFKDKKMQESFSVSSQNIIKNFSSEVVNEEMKKIYSEI